MYSVILMAALSTNGPDAVAFGRHRGGCQGCYGGCAGCYGWGCGGCYGWGCGGCYGNVSYGMNGCHGWRRSCFGCYGGTACYGGCYGSCMGCHGHWAGCYGGCYGAPVWYGHGWQGAGNPMVAPPAQPPTQAPPPAPKSDAQPETRPMGGAAKLIIELPAGSTLFVDDRPLPSNETTRNFSTPVLEPGQTYYYTVRVEGTRDGQPINESRRVFVRANETIHESFLTAKPDAMAHSGR